MKTRKHVHQLPALDGPPAHSVTQKNVNNYLLAGNKVSPKTQTQGCATSRCESHTKIQNPKRKDATPVHGMLQLQQRPVPPLCPYIR